MKVKCLQCGHISDESEWLKVEFYCDSCNDDHRGEECPNPDCKAIEGPGISPVRERVNEPS